MLRRKNHGIHVVSVRGASGPDHAARPADPAWAPRQGHPDRHRLEQLDTDGELVRWREGRPDFAGLQQRLDPTDRQARQLALLSPAT